MQTSENIMIRLAGAVMILAVMLPCLCACRSVEQSAIACPQGMVSAAKQRICIASPCGNESLDEGEECDDGNHIDGDGCSFDCHSTEVCGNSIVDHVVGEVCDDGNLDPDETCCSDCRSCPEMAVMPYAETLVTDIDPLMPVAPCPDKPAVVTSPHPFSLESFMHSPVLPTSVQAEPNKATPTWVMEDLERAREAERRAQQKAKYEQDARKRMTEAHAIVSNQLRHAQDVITQIEQRKIELQQYIETQCQHPDSGRTNDL